MLFQIKQINEPSKSGPILFLSFFAKIRLSLLFPFHSFLPFLVDRCEHFLISLNMSLSLIETAIFGYGLFDRKREEQR